MVLYLIIWQFQFEGELIIFTSWLIFFRPTFRCAGELKLKFKLCRKGSQPYQVHRPEPNAKESSWYLFKIKSKQLVDYSVSSKSFISFDY